MTDVARQPLDSLVIQLKARLRQDASAVDAWLHTVHYNDLRALRVKLANEVSDVTERHPVDGGRRKSDLYKSIYRLGRVAVAVEDGVHFEQPDVMLEGGPGGGASTATAAGMGSSASSSSAAAAAAAAGSSKKRVAEDEPARNAGAMEEELEHKYGFMMERVQDGEDIYDGPDWVPLPPDDRQPVPTLEELGLERGSVAHALASNDFSLSTLDSCCQGSSAIADALPPLDFSAIGAGLLLNNRLRHLILPFSQLGEAQVNALFSPVIRAGHRLGLTTLDLRGNQMGRACGEIVASLVGLCPNLLRLRLEGNDFGERALELIVKALPPSLGSLSLSKCTTKVCTALAGVAVPLLSELRLVHGSIGDAALAKLSAALGEPSAAASSVLAVLDLRHNEITAKGIGALVELMHNMPSLWLVQDAGNPCHVPGASLCGSSVALFEKACEKFHAVAAAAPVPYFHNGSSRIAAAASVKEAALVDAAGLNKEEQQPHHPSVEMHTILMNNNRFTSLTPRKCLSRLYACLAAGADPTTALTAGGMSPLECAVTHFCDGRVADLLLSSVGGGAGLSSLLMRYPGISAQNLRVLLENGLDSSAMTKDGVPMLVIVATHAWARGRSLDPRGWLYKFELLVRSKGIDVNAADADGETVLSVLSRSTYRDIVSLLLRCGSNIEARDRSNLNTCLHWAAKYGSASVLRVLLKHAPSLLDARNAKGQSPLDLATANAHAEVELELMMRLKKHKQGQ